MNVSDLNLIKPARVDSPEAFCPSVVELPTLNTFPAITLVYSNDHRSAASIVIETLAARVPRWLFGSCGPHDGIEVQSLHPSSRESLTGRFVRG